MDRGYDVKNDVNYKKYYFSKIPVEVVDEIEDEIFRKHQEYVKNIALSKYGITLKQNQIDALADFCYNGHDIFDVLQAMSNGNLTQNSAYGFIFDQSSGGYGRGLRRWILFEKGIYLDAEGKEII